MPSVFRCTTGDISLTSLVQTLTSKECKMYFVVGQVVLMPTRDKGYRGLLPCDGRELPVDQYNMIAYMIGNQYGDRLDDPTKNIQWQPNPKPDRYINLPTLESPLKGYTYYICIEGEMPQLDW